jgi:hypothetical protein
MLIVVRYNDIPEVDDLPEIPTGTLEALAKIFFKHNVQGLFGVGLIHSHCTLNDGEVMLSTHLQTPRAGCWNRATKMNGVALYVTHGKPRVPFPNFLLVP